MKSPATEKYLALLRQLEAVVFILAERTPFGLSRAVSSWLADAATLDARETEEILGDIRELLMLKAARDRRRWAASWRATGELPVFESEWNAQIVNLRLGEVSQLSDSAFRRELKSLEAIRDDGLEALIRRVADRLGAAQPMIIPLGCAVEFVPIDEWRGVG